MYKDKLVVNLFDLFEITPLWKKQNENEPHQVIAMMIGLLGLTHAFFTIPIWITANFTTDLLNLANQDIPQILIILTNFLWDTILAIIFDLIILVVLLSNSNFLKSVDINEEWSILKETVANTLEFSNDKTNTNKILVKYVVSLFILGYIAGIYYAFILYIPFFILYFFLFLIIFTEVSVGYSFVTSLFFSWSIFIYILLKRKFTLEVEENDNFQPKFIRSERTFNIAKSNMAPIVCPACRSYIAAKSKKCQVCDEIIPSD